MEVRAESNESESHVSAGPSSLAAHAAVLERVQTVAPNLRFGGVYENRRGFAVSTEAELNREGPAWTVPFAVPSRPDLFVLGSSDGVLASLRLAQGVHLLCEYPPEVFIGQALASLTLVAPAHAPAASRQLEPSSRFVRSAGANPELFLERELLDPSIAGAFVLEPLWHRMAFVCRDNADGRAALALVKRSSKMAEAIVKSRGEHDKEDTRRALVEAGLRAFGRLEPRRSVWIVFAEPVARGAAFESLDRLTATLDGASRRSTLQGGWMAAPRQR